MKIAIVGPRQGADLEAVRLYVESLPRDTTVVSGGATGVDITAETHWLAQGGRVWSYRIRKRGDEKYVIEKWDMGGERPAVHDLQLEPSWADPTSALLYRSMLVAEAADEIRAFGNGNKMRGTEFTIFVGREGEQKPTFVWEDGEWR